MNSVTKLIKTNIKKDFPNAKISVKYVSATNYTGSSDKIKIRTSIPYKNILTYLIQNTKGVAIYPKGTIASKRGDFGSCIFEKESDVEFIEIETI